MQIAGVGPAGRLLVAVGDYRFRRSRRALRFLLPILRRRRGLDIRVSPFDLKTRYLSVRRPARLANPIGRTRFRPRRGHICASREPGHASVGPDNRNLRFFPWNAPGEW